VKPFIKAGLIASGLLALFSLCVSVYLVRNLLQKVPSNETQNTPVHHFSLYIPNTRNTFFSEIVTGARRAAVDCNAALSVHTLDQAGTGLGMAAWISADGIAVYPDIDDSVTKDKLEQLRKKSIPVVLVNHNIQASQPWPFIGTNNYDFGKKVGSFIHTWRTAGIHLAVIYSDKNPSMYAERELVEMGIRVAVNDHALTSASGYRTDISLRAAEQVVYRLIRTQGDLNTIIFTDTNDTLAGTQALIDLNLVGRIQIVGFGSDPAILDYIKKGVISGTLVVNPQNIGYQAIISLAELCKSGYTSNSVDTGISLVTAENLGSYESKEKKDRS